MSDKQKTTELIKKLQVKRDCYRVLLSRAINDRAAEDKKIALLRYRIERTDKLLDERGVR